MHSATISLRMEVSLSARSPRSRGTSKHSLAFVDWLRVTENLAASIAAVVGQEARPLIHLGPTGPEKAGGYALLGLDDLISQCCGGVVGDRFGARSQYLSRAMLIL